MKNFIPIAAFALFVSLFYTAVGNLLPQMESRPPANPKVGVEISNDDLVSAGSGVFETACSQCHKIGGVSRCPDLAGMGRTAHDRAAQRARETSRAFTDVDYLLESLCNPGAFLAPGFETMNIMPPQHKALSPGQLLAVTAFLQDQGSNVSVPLADAAKTNEMLAAHGCSSGAGGAEGGAAVVDAAPVGKPEEVWTTFGCNACHSIDSDARLIGPSLADVGKRLDKGQIFEAILTPDATMSAGEPPYTPKMMSMTLEGNGFYQRMKPADYQALVDWLATHG